MRIIQLLPTISYGDAVGNDTMAVDALIRDMGYETTIYAENIDPRLPTGIALPVSHQPELSDEDIIVYHGSVGTVLNEKLVQMKGRKLMIYHNITPPHYFRDYSEVAENLSSYGLNGVKRLSKVMDYCIADSEFNKSDLLSMGFKCPIDVCPIIIPFSDYEKEPDKSILDFFKRGKTSNILFVGRLSPNKKQEDIILAFYIYHNYYNPDSRLILCGSWDGMDLYHQRLVNYTKRLGLFKDVIFTGHIKFGEVLAWYHIADAFVCMSEHEGFCVPLVEAMHFGVPIIAYRSCAVPETLGSSGVIVEKKDPIVVAKAINSVVSDAMIRDKVISAQNERVKVFSYESVSEKFKIFLEGFINGRTK